ncbi:MAG: polyphenol oxidase family protein, partial [Spirochaetales bacterium]|nr:polyphenol oxidase family protein [Spirochaetales bacterium]
MSESPLPRPGWFSLTWPEGGAEAPAALLSLAELGDMPVKPRPPERVFDQIARVFPGRRFVWLAQEHTRIVHRADADCQAAGRVGDGLVTNDQETLIGVTVADCMPVFLWDRASGARAVLHSGWKGTGIVREALRLMRNCYGSEAANIYAILGPGIRACCYAVPQERAESFALEFGEAS